MGIASKNFVEQNQLQGKQRRMSSASYTVGGTGHLIPRSQLVACSSPRNSYNSDSSESQIISDSQTKVFCCCEAQTWSLAIGWIHVIGAIAILVLGSLTSDSRLLNFYCGRFTSEGPDSPVRHVFGFIILLLGCLLLIGVYRKERIFIGVWLIANGIGLAGLVYFCGLYLLAFWRDFATERWFVFLILFALIGIQSFFVHVVSTYREELIREMREQSGHFCFSSLCSPIMDCDSSITFTENV